MSVVPTQGQPWTFLAEFFQYAGGPPTDVTNLQFEVFDITTSTTVLGPTNIGISHRHGCVRVDVEPDPG